MVWYCMTIIIFPTRQSLCCYLYHVIWTISLTVETQMPERRKTMKIIFKSPGGHLWSQCCTFEEASANLVHPKVQHYFLSVSRNMVHPKARNHFLLFEITNCSFFTFTVLQWFAFIVYLLSNWKVSPMQWQACGSLFRGDLVRDDGGFFLLIVPLPLFQSKPCIFIKLTPIQ